MKKIISQTIFIATMVTAIFTSCSNEKISKEQLTIIDGIVLGQSSDSLVDLFKKLNISHDNFYTRSIFVDINEIESCMLTLPYSEVFDLSDYRNPSIKLSHKGILYPTQLSGTDRIVGMNVILVHTTEPYPFNPAGVNYLIGDEQCIDQEVNELLIDEIIKIYTSKYGEPESRVMTNFQEAFVFEWNAIKRYNGTKDEGELITWANDIMTIKFFTGCKSYNATFRKNPTYYIIHGAIGGERELPIIEYDKGIVGCFTFPYIQYTLKDSIINLLGLDKKRI